MKTRLFTYLLLCFFAAGFAQNRDTFCLDLFKVNMLIQRNHYSPKAVNDSLSNYVFDNFIAQLDDDRIIFLQQEVDSLEKYRYKLDDAIKDTDCAFLNDFISYYKNGLERNLTLLEELKTEPYKPELSDTLTYVKHRPFYDNAQQVKNLYRKQITYEVLEQVVKSAANKDSLYAQLPVIARKMQLQTLENYKCRIQNLLNPSGGLDRHFMDLYFNVLTSYYDPHTNYFNTDSRNEFFNTISSTNLSFGLVMEMSATNQVSVQDILSGSPAFRDPRIEIGDRLIRVQYEEKDFEVNCVNMDVVYNYFHSDTYKNLNLTFRKKNGVDYEARLQKESLKNYENTSYSFLIDGNKKMGYIHIPSFYSNNEGDATNLYDDFVFELNHLKKEGAKGFIIDLQNNGGGDMEQAFLLISLFIDHGPVTVLHHRRRPPNVIYNLKEKRMYDEPIVVLINGYTASASEVFAFVMQDYKRGVLLGQRSFGKASLQTFFPVDENDFDSALLKMTIEKMYSMNGTSHQLNGVKPDILTPALLQPLFMTEKDKKNALPADQFPHSYEIKGRLPRAYMEAITAGLQRAGTQPHYLEIERLNTEVERQIKSNTPIPLDFKSIAESIDYENDFFNALTEMYEKTYDINLRLLQKDQNTIQYNSLLQNMFESKKERILTNPDIYEAVLVLEDML